MVTSNYLKPVSIVLSAFIIFSNPSPTGDYQARVASPL